MSLYDRVLAREGGSRALAVSRLRRAVLSCLYEAFNSSGIGSQSDLAKRLGVRRSAVNQVFHGDGNLRISTLAEYLHEMGYELDLTLVRSGEPRAAALEGRETQPAFLSAAYADSPVLFFKDGFQATVDQSPALPHLVLHAPPGFEGQSQVLVRRGPQEGLPEQPASRSTQIRMDNPRNPR